MVTFFLVFLSLFFLVFLHELSHFLVAKILGVKVEEFGIGYPPRLFGKKIGETIYSINIFPFGAFVRLFGEIEEKKEKGSFSAQPVSKKILIVLAGVISFWVFSTLLFTFLFLIGSPVSGSDEENLPFAKVQIVRVMKNSPAEIAGLRAGDFIREMKVETCEHKECFLKTDKVREVQNFIHSHLKEEIILTIERGKKILSLKVTPRKFPPQGEGPIGVILARIGIKKYPPLQAPFEGAKLTFNITLAIVEGYFEALNNFFSGLPTGIEVRGPVGILEMMHQVTQLGLRYFLNFLGFLSIYLAIFNLLPIPALDGGKILFLTIEGIRKKPIPPKVEQKITLFFFGLLIFLAILITMKDISRLF